MKLTARVVDGLAKAVVQAERFVWDDDVPGLGVRMRVAGSRNWIYQYKLGVKNRRMTLGSITAIGLVKARNIAADLHAKVRLGADPAADKIEAKATAVETFKVIAEKFLKFKDGKVGAVHYSELSRYLLADSKPLHEIPVKGIRRRHIADLLSDVRTARGDSTADHLRAALSGFFTWALKQGLMGDEGSNPVTYTHREKAKARDRVLKLAELREVWEATANQDDDYNQIVRLLILTLQRRDEIADLDRGEVDFETGLITLPPTRTKNKQEHKLPMSAPVAATLSGRHTIAGRTLFFGIAAGGYSGWSKSKEKLDARILAARQKRLGKAAQAMPAWTLHDLRRTGDTMLNDVLHIEPHVVEAIVNHVSGSKSGKGGVAGVYNRAEYLAKKKDALDRWATFIQAEFAIEPSAGDRPFERPGAAQTTSQAVVRLPPAA